MYNLQNIKNIAERKKTTIREIGDYCGVSAESLHKSIKTNNISLVTLDKICHFFNMPMNEIIAQDLKNTELSGLKITDGMQYMIDRFETLAQEKGKIENELERYKAYFGDLPENNIAAEPSPKIEKK